jgi:hypothetical protein
VRIQKELIKEERQKILKTKENLLNVEVKKKSAVGNPLIPHMLYHI